MSLLKQKIAKKLTALLGYEVSAEDVYFPKNGGRRDVVRWAIFGYECFSAAAFSARSDVVLTISDSAKPYGVIEIFAMQPVDKEKPAEKPKKPNPFDTAFRPRVEI